MLSRYQDISVYIEIVMFNIYDPKGVMKLKVNFNCKGGDDQKR